MLDVDYTIFLTPLQETARLVLGYRIWHRRGRGNPVPTDCRLGV
ncbi:MAG: hypothetical protein ACP5JJ_15265 [Anaerolineae bacterium]